MKIQTQKVLQLIAVIAVAYIIYQYGLKKQPERFRMRRRFQNPLTEQQGPLYNDIGPRATSDGTGSYASLGGSCSTCAN
jgi:hypothetical protein